VILILFSLMFKYILYSYINHISYFFFAFGLSFLLLGICYLFSTSNWYFEKITSYECGFDPFSDTREPFEIKFYIIAILFIIFDVEVIFFFPWVISQNQLLIFGYYTMYIFYLILIIGFFYEFKKGSLDWN
jgi:NADH:ubiquinone oxidoreductase subunit 3 (subunit A)